MNTPIENPPSASPLNQLEQLRKFTRVVADTGDFEPIKQFAPEDATTNPTLILKAVQKPEYQTLLQQAIADGKKTGASPDDIMRETNPRLFWD